MSDYKKGIIYAIHHKSDLELTNPYIGSTFNFDERMRDHKSDCYNFNRRNYNYKLYQHIRANGGWDCYDVKIIEYYDCKDKDELRKREDEVMLLYSNRLNTFRSYRNKKEYRRDNKDKILEYRKKHYEANKDKIKQKVICDKCGSSVRRDYLERHKRNAKCINFICQKHI